MSEPIRAIRDQDEKPLHRSARAPAAEKTTWVDIALGIYVGGLALAITSAVFWMLIIGISMKAISIR